MKLNTLHEGRLSQMVGPLAAAAGMAIGAGGSAKSAYSGEVPTQSSPRKVAAQGALNYKGIIRQHEGVRTRVYIDTKGNPSVGIGFNLNRAGARAALKAVGADYDKVKDGSQSLTRDQIEKLFDQDVKTAIGAARRAVKSFESQPDQVKIILVDMAFNLGEDKLKGFVKMRQALEQKDYQTAADEMIDSAWYDQVGDRSKTLVAMMRAVR